MSVNAAAQLRRTSKVLKESESHEKLKQNDLFADEVQRLTQLHLKFIMF